MVWQACEGERHIKPLAGRLYRLVESQEQIATLTYVDTLEEQALLEELLEEAKPPYREPCDDYHYLLKTPFRYPPLQWGSRFGRVHEPSLFYGGTTPEVTLAESAYYRFVFRHSISGEPPKPALRSEHTMFSTAYSSDYGMQLHMPPFTDYTNQLQHLSNYAPSQQLGSDMRTAGVQVFEYGSARDKQHQPCAALYTLKALAQKHPDNLEPWLCEITETEVAFKPVSSLQVKRFQLKDFCVEGVLPLPA